MTIFAYSFRKSAIEAFISGGGLEINTGIAGEATIPFNGRITAVEMENDQTGSIKVDIWKSTQADYPPTDADTITGGNEPEISAGRKDQDTDLDGWTTEVNEGDKLLFNVDSVTTCTWALLTLYLEKRELAWA